MRAASLGLGYALGAAHSPHHRIVVFSSVKLALLAHFKFMFAKESVVDLD